MLELLNPLYVRKKIFVAMLVCIVMFLGLMGRLAYLAIWQADYYSEKAQELHERERSIKAARGRILDRNGVVLADNKTVCTVSVIYSQIKEPQRVIDILSEELSLPKEYVAKQVGKFTSREKIKSNVDKQIGDRIREYDLAGVKVDEDYKRYYPFRELASKVLGFTGGDNQGILGLEVTYEAYLQGKPGLILTVTDAKGIEIEAAGERRLEPMAGLDLTISLDSNIQAYATLLAKQACETKEAEGVSILVMNPQNGEIYACVDVPEYDLNHPFELSAEEQNLDQKAKRDAWNRIWRNRCISDTYEPGSTFKIITASAGLEDGCITPHSVFHCPGSIRVDDRVIRCHKRTGHGSQDFTHCMMNSCNPALISVGLRLGIDKYYSYFEQFGLKEKTGVDLPGEARTIMHQKENMGNVELATVAFGQSFQVTPIQMLTTVSSLINGGRRITPHFALSTSDETGAVVDTFSFEEREGIVSEETSATLRQILEMVVSDGSGRNGQVAGFRIGGKTATSQTLPRNSGRYISSFIGFAPADDPRVIAIAIIYTPKGIYYGGQVAAPIIRQLYENILPYLGIERYNQ